MREKKFRAWDKVAKKFLYPWPDGFHILGETTCFDLIGQQLGERKPKGNILAKLNDVEITQWTGLKDKKDKEIYEGDILKLDTEDIVKIIFSFAMFKVTDKFVTFPLIDVMCPAKPECEIIGNIYEDEGTLN